MTVTEFVDHLFAGYAATPELADFKAEVLANLNDRIADLEAGGASPAEALARAQDELGDISDLAQQLAGRRAQDVFASMYLRQRVRPTTAQLLSYILAGTAVVAGLTLVAVGLIMPWPIGVVAVVAVVLLALPIGAATAVALTQETTNNMPMRQGRALAYGTGVFLILAGLGVAGVLLTDAADRWVAALAVGLPLVVGGTGLLTFLGVTQTNRKKPWLRARMEQDQQAASAWQPGSESDERWARFGVFNIALWLTATALFVLGGSVFGFRYSWVVFLVAIAGTMLLVGWGLKGSLTAAQVGTSASAPADDGPVSRAPAAR